MSQEQFEKYSFNKSLNQMIKRVKSVESIRSESFKDSPMIFSNIQSITSISKNLIRLYEFVYYNICIEENIEILSKKLKKAVMKYDMDLNDFYTTKFEIFTLLKVSSVDEFLTSMTQEEISRVSIIYFIEAIVELIVCKTDKRIIVGVDRKNNEIRYITNNELLLDKMNSKFVTEHEKRTYKKFLPIAARQLIDRFGDLSVPEAAVLANDKIDECLNDIRETRIILGTLGITSSINAQMRLSSMKTSQCVRAGLELWSKRSCICTEDAVLYYETGKIRVIKLKDIMLKENYPCMVITYITDDNVEDTVVIPTKMNSVIYCPYVELMEKIDDFFSGNVDGNIVDDSFWQYRFAKDKNEIVRNYRSQIKTIAMHRAKLGNPSQTVVNFAKEWGIKLEPGETIVKKHLRRYGRSK